MTITAEPTAALPAHRVRQRRRWIVAAAVAVVAAAGLTGTGVLRHLDHQYGPLGPGPFGGPYSKRGLVFSTDGFSYHLADQPGATAQLLGSVQNLGAHSVKITGIDTDSIVSDIRWSAFRLADGGSVTGVPTPWRTFPAIVPPHGMVRLRLTIHHPANCNAYPKIRGLSTARYGGDAQLHWESLLHAHTTLVQVLGAADDAGLRIC